MRAVIFEKPGGVEVLQIAEVPRPRPGPEDLLVRNFAAGVNRADILQRRGLYPPPPGASEILGLEFAGEVAEIGEKVSGFRKGDRVFGLVAGGAYAEFLTVSHRTVLPIPDTLSFDAAASLPEACSIAAEALFALGDLRSGDLVLLHAGASGVGSAAIQLAVAKGGRVLATAGSGAKVEHCLRLGAERALNHREEDFVEAVGRATEGRGVPLVLDLVGAAYMERNLRCLAVDGRMVIVGLLGGAIARVDLSVVLRKRLRILGTTLRGRSAEERIRLCEMWGKDILPLVVAGKVRPALDRVVPFEEVQAAHERMESNSNIGKIVLRL